MLDVLRGHLDRSLRSLGLSNQSRNGSRKLGFIHSCKTTIGFLKLGKQRVHAVCQLIRTGVNHVGKL